MEENKTTTEMNEKLIRSFIEIASSSREEATFFLESHRWDLDAAVSSFLDNDDAVAVEPTGPNPNDQQLPPFSVAAASPSQSHSPDYSPSETSPSRSRSPSPPSRDAPYRLRSKGASQNQEADNPSGSRNSRSRQHAGNIRTFADLNRPPAGGAESDSDEAQEYYTGGEKSGMMVQDPRKAKDVDAFFEQARQSAVERPVESSRSTSRSFTGAARLLSGETVSSTPQEPQDQPQLVMHTITFWRNGFTVDDGPLRRFDDPANATFMESIARSECPRELEPVDKKIRVHVDLVRREDNFTEPAKPKTPFQGVGRTLGASGSGSVAAGAQASPAPMNTAPTPLRGLVVDQAAPTTSIQLRLADGTRLVSRFNNHHTIRDVRGFIDASRPGGSKEYQLLTMGFPPKQLTELEQTIEQAGIANSVVIQKF